MNKLNGAASAHKISYMFVFFLVRFTPFIIRREKKLTEKSFGVRDQKFNLVFDVCVLTIFFEKQKQYEILKSDVNGFIYS